MNAHPMKARIRDEGATARVDVYDDIGTGGWLADGLTAADFAAQLGAVKGALDVHINSGGGDVFDGLAIAQAIRGHKAPVTTVVDGIAASIASVIFQAGEHRVMAPGSMLMIHDAFGGVEGNAAEVAKFAETLGKVSDNLAAVYADRAGGDPGVWRDAMRAETWYTAEEAVDAGLADRISGDMAAIPGALDLAAFSTIPGRIAARLLAAQPRPQVQDKDYSADERKEAASEGHAMPDGSFPINDEEDLHNAIHLAGNAKDPAAARRHIIKRAAALGASDAIPDSWNADGSTGGASDHLSPAVTAAAPAVWLELDDNAISNIVAGLKEAKQ